MIVFRLYKILITFVLAGIISSTSAQNVITSDSITFICVSPINLADGPVRLIEDNKGQMIIAITGKKGLIGIVKDSIIEQLVTGFISDAALGPDGNIWYMGQKQINSVSFSKVNTNQNFVSLFFRDSIPDNIANSNDPLFYRDRLGSLWLSKAPFRVGADMKSLPNPQSDIITGRFPFPRTTDPFGNMWGLIETGEKEARAIGVLSPGESAKWRVFDKSNGFPVDQWHSVVADIEGIIWVSGKAGLCYFDPYKSGRGWRHFPVTEQYPGGAVSQLTLSSTGHALLALQNGKIFEVNVDARDLPVIKSVGTVGLPGFPVSALYTDRGGRIWVVMNNKLYRQDKQEEYWQALTSMPYGNHDVFGVELNGKIYIPGGGAYYGLPVISKNFDCLLIYDTQNDRWEISSPMSINRRYCNVGLLDGKIWVIGGYNKTSEKEGVMWNDLATNTVEIYDPKTRSWSSAPSLDLPRAETVTCTIADRLYVFGSSGKEIYSTLSIASGEKQWRVEPAAPYPVLQTNGCVLDNRAYIMIGGVGLIMYDPATQTWHKDFPPVPGSKAPLSSALITHNGKIWVISGREIDDETKVFIFAPGEKQWSYGPSFPYPAKWANGIEVNGRLYAFGGATLSKYRNRYVYWDAIRVLK
jgi:N-acetylneuraminic acid mutarotase